ncbi:hypothetical protein MTO96_001433 [Rhipicephalus appendiculatus]
MGSLDPRPIKTETPRSTSVIPSGARLLTSGRRMPGKDNLGDVSGPPCGCNPGTSGRKDALPRQESLCPALPANALLAALTPVRRRRCAE